MNAKYLYGIIRDPHTSKLGAIDLPEGRGDVRVVRQDRIAGVVSDYQGPPLSELPRQQLLRHLVVHQQVLEWVMRDRAVLPVKFGTVLPGSSQVRRALRCGAGQLEGAMLRLQGLVQYEVAVTWDLKAVLAEIAREGPIAVLAEKARAQSAVAAGAASEPSPAASCISQAEMLELRVKVGALVKEALDRRREELRCQLTSLLSEQAVDRQENALMGDEMVGNIAFLVRSSSEGRFLERVHEVDARFDGRLGFRCIGPFPPYNFGTVVISRPDTEKLETAVRILGLGERISVEEVRKAYRSKALTLHPDVSRSAGAGEKFSVLREAERVLVAYCAGRKELGGKDTRDRCKVCRDDVEKTYLVSVTGSAE